MVGTISMTSIISLSVDGATQYIQMSSEVRYGRYYKYDWY